MSQEIVSSSVAGQGRASGSSPLVLQTSPYLRQGVTTPGVMVDVLIALAPAVAASIWLFGISGLLVLIAATAGAVATEWALSGRPGGQAPLPSATPIAPGTVGFEEAARPSLAGTLRDGSAPLTGVILGLTLPPSLPLWMAFLGGVVAIALGKAAWGGLGQNLFNPALVGRAFLQAAFPVAITTWVPPQGPFSLYAGNFALPFFQAPPDAVSAATPLNLMKFEQAATPVSGLFWGTTAGSLGETSVLAMLLGGAWLLLRRACDWRIPASILLSVAALSGALWLASPEGYPSPVFMLFSGGLLFGALFMATDPVTSPLTPRGTWIFGIGIGALVVTIRLWGGLPEGVMYAILLMNAATPLIERVAQPRPFGRPRQA